MDFDHVQRINLAVDRCLYPSGKTLQECLAELADDPEWTVGEIQLVRSIVERVLRARSDGEQL